LTTRDSSPVIRTLIVDDEALARDLLRRLVARDPALALVGEAASGLQALAKIRELAPDLVLLDIQMPAPNGLEVVARLLETPESVPYIVFVTAFDRHAVSAFELNALDYLVKPVEKSRFEQAMLRATRAVHERAVVALTERLIALTRNEPVAHPERDDARCLTVRRGEELLAVPLAEIRWVEADNQYVRVHAGDATHVLPWSLAQFERRYGDSELLRVHRSALVNPQRVTRILRKDNGLHVLELEDGTRVDVARSRSDLLQRILQRSRRRSP
jgi:two-component system, LytTR family, response regulator